MEIKSETKWLCENARNLEKFSGKWVVFRSDDGVVGAGASLQKALKSCREQAARSFVFHVPSKKELISPFVVARKK